jgi:flavodoxin/NAD-dependent dihydropyrimidine dehydrogenase PreA subunit
VSKTLIVHFSQGGTTAQVAESIATGLRAAQHEVDLCNLKDEPAPFLEGYDMLGIGSPTYWYRPPFNVMDYVNSLPDLEGLPSFVFVLHGTHRGDTGNALRCVLARKGAQEVGYFHCRGADYALIYLKAGYLFSPGHPTEEELAGAEAFGHQIAGRFAGQPHPRSRDDPPQSWVYRLERFLSSRWLTRHLYSRLFEVNPHQCTACGDCIKLCPTRNVTAAQGGLPVWGRNCLLCFTCQMKCPEDAITSPIDWPLFRPFTAYNVRQACRDPLLDHARVVHSRGHTHHM